MILFIPLIKVKVKVKLLSRVQLFAAPWTVAPQAPPSMGFSRQEYWSGLPFPSPGESSLPRDRTLVSRIAGSRFNLWATKEELFLSLVKPQIYVSKDPFSIIILFVSSSSMNIKNTIFYIIKEIKLKSTDPQNKTKHSNLGAGQKVDRRATSWMWGPVSLKENASHLLSLFFRWKILIP